MKVAVNDHESDTNKKSSEVIDIKIEVINKNEQPVVTDKSATLQIEENSDPGAAVIGGVVQCTDEEVTDPCTTDKNTACSNGRTTENDCKGTNECEWSNPDGAGTCQCRRQKLEFIASPNLACGPGCSATEEGDPLTVMFDFKSGANNDVVEYYDNSANDNSGPIGATVYANANGERTLDFETYETLYVTYTCRDTGFRAGATSDDPMVGWQGAGTTKRVAIEVIDVNEKPFFQSIVDPDSNKVEMQVDENDMTHLAINENFEAHLKCKDRDKYNDRSGSTEVLWTVSLSTPVTANVAKGATVTQTNDPMGSAPVTVTGTLEVALTDGVPVHEIKFKAAKGQIFDTWYDIKINSGTPTLSSTQLADVTGDTSSEVELEMTVEGGGVSPDFTISKDPRWNNWCAGAILKPKRSLDFEKKQYYNLVITAADLGVNPANGNPGTPLSETIHVRIRVRDRNDDPVIARHSDWSNAAWDVSEDAAKNFVVGKFTLMDPDIDELVVTWREDSRDLDTLTVTIESGNDGTPFELETLPGTTGTPADKKVVDLRYRGNAPMSPGATDYGLDYERQKEYTLVIRVTDNGGPQKLVSIGNRPDDTNILRPAWTKTAAFHEITQTIRVIDVDDVTIDNVAIQNAQDLLETAGGDKVWITGSNFGALWSGSTTTFDVTYTNPTAVSDMSANDPTSETGTGSAGLPTVFTAVGCQRGPDATWTMGINAQDITKAQGATVSQNGNTGTLVVGLLGEGTTVVTIKAAADQTFVTAGHDLVIGAAGTQSTVTPTNILTAEKFVHNDRIICDAAPGFGNNQIWTVTTSGGSSGTATSVGITTSYSFPIIEDVSVKGGNHVMSTLGGEEVLLKGTNMGPVGTEFWGDYGPTRLSGLGYCAGRSAGGGTGTWCRTTVADTQVTCATSAGIGTLQTFQLTERKHPTWRTLSDSARSAGNTWTMTITPKTLQHATETVVTQDGFMTWQFTVDSWGLKNTCQNSGANTACAGVADPTIDTCAAANTIDTCTVKAGGANTACAGVVQPTSDSCLFENNFGTCTVTNGGTNADCAAVVQPSRVACDAATTSGNSGNSANDCVFTDHDAANDCVFTAGANCLFTAKSAAQGVPVTQTSNTGVGVLAIELVAGDYTMVTVTSAIGQTFDDAADLIIKAAGGDIIIPQLKVTAATSETTADASGKLRVALAGTDQNSVVVSGDAGAVFHRWFTQKLRKICLLKLLLS